MTSYAAQEAAFNRAQRAYEARTEPDEADAADDPRYELICDRVWSTPSILIDAIAEQIETGYDEAVPNIDRLTNGRYDAHKRPAAELLAVLLNASNPRDVMAAQMALKDAIEDALTREALRAWEAV